MGEDFKEYIDRKMRLGKVDSFLLYLTSLFGFLYSLAQFFLSTVEDIIYFIPLLIPGLILPIYFGYCRGALKDSAEDRVRGWLYLIVGAPFYVIPFLSSLVQKPIEQYVSVNVERIVPLLLALLMASLVGGFVGMLGRELENFIFYLCGRKSSFATDEMSIDTALSAIFLSTALSIVPLLKPSPLTTFLPRLFLMTLFLIVAYILGRYSSKWSILSKYSEYVRTKQLKPSPKYHLFHYLERISFGLLLGSIIITALIETPLTGTLRIIEIAAIIGIFLVGLFSIIMSERYSPKTLLEIKDDIEVPDEIKKVLEKLIKELS